MKLETVKSFILVVLIGISLILSYTLWSYQPNSGQTIGGKLVENEMIKDDSDDESKRSMVKPSKIIFHTGEEYYGFLHAIEQDFFYQKLQEWNITNFEVLSEKSMIDEHSSEKVEIVFPVEISMRILDSLFTFGQDDIDFPNWSMKRMLISFIHDSKSLQVEFIPEGSNQTVVALINDANKYEELLSTITELDEKSFREYLVINEDTNPVYIPSGEIGLPTYSITPSEIKPALFVDILFTNPTVVRETRSQTIGEVYFTDNRQLSVFHDGMRMEYVSHLTPEDSDRTLSEKDLLDYSIVDINSHGGWTQDYRLEHIDLDINQVTFQMYYDGYPVFNSYKLTTIEQRWEIYQNSIQLVEYNRPLYLFESEFIWRKSTHIPSGEDILIYLDKNPDLSVDNIQDITIGYELKYQQDDEYIELAPAWFKKENNNWQKITFSDEALPRGGD